MVLRETVNLKVLVIYILQVEVGFQDFACQNGPSSQLINPIECNKLIIKDFCSKILVSLIHSHKRDGISMKNRHYI